MPVQRVDAIYIEFKFHSMPDVGFYDFGVYRRWVEAIRTHFTDTSGAPL
jgi:uncharacterized protein (DUF1499 family)